MIKIKMFKEKWRIEISEECFEFESKKEFKDYLEKLIADKENYGRLKTNEQESSNRF